MALRHLRQPLNDADIARRIREQIESSIAPIPLNGCTRETLRCPDARDYGAELRDCCKGHIRRIVADTAAILNEMRLTWWADYGTLLGAVRNPLTKWANYPWLNQKNRTTTGPAAGIVPHDKDADFGIFGVDFRALGLIRAKLERMGYQVLIRPGGRSMKVRLSARNHTNADFFVWREVRDGVLARPKYISADHYKGRDCHRDQVFPLTTVPWEGMTLPAPKDPAAFCEFRYGPDWMKPIQANNDGIRRGESR